VIPIALWMVDAVAPRAARRLALQAQQLHKHLLMVEQLDPATVQQRQKFQQLDARSHVPFSIPPAVLA